MFRISKDTPAFYLTSVAKDRLPVFRTDAIKEIACAALDEARRSAGFFLFAYVVMPDHLHSIVGSELKPSKVEQYINGIIAHRIIQHLKTNGHEESLKKLRHADKGRGYKHSLWDHHPHAKLIPAEEMFLQKVNYLHKNPVRAGLVERAEDYRWSSARWWAKKPDEDEPLRVDLDEILGAHASRRSLQDFWAPARRAGGISQELRRRRRGLGLDVPGKREAFRKDGGGAAGALIRHQPGKPEAFRKESGRAARRLDSEVPGKPEAFRKDGGGAAGDWD